MHQEEKNTSMENMMQRSCSDVLFTIFMCTKEKMWPAHVKIKHLYRASSQLKESNNLPHFMKNMKEAANEFETVFEFKGLNRTIILIGEQHGSKMRQTFFENVGMLSDPLVILEAPVIEFVDLDEDDDSNVDEMRYDFITRGIKVIPADIRPKYLGHLTHPGNENDVMFESQVFRSHVLEQIEYSISVTQYALQCDHVDMAWSFYKKEVMPAFLQCVWAHNIPRKLEHTTEPLDSLLSSQQIEESSGSLYLKLKSLADSTENATAEQTFFNAVASQSNEELLTNAFSTQERLECADFKQAAHFCQRKICSWYMAAVIMSKLDVKSKERFDTLVVYAGSNHVSDVMPSLRDVLYGTFEHPFRAEELVLDGIWL